MTNLDLNLIRKKINQVLEMFNTVENELFTMLSLLSMTRGKVKFNKEVRVDNFIIKVESILHDPYYCHVVTLKPIYQGEYPPYYIRIHLPISRKKDISTLFKMIEKFINILKNFDCYLTLLKIQYDIDEIRIRFSGRWYLKIEVLSAGIDIVLDDNQSEYDTLSISCFLNLEVN